VSNETYNPEAYTWMIKAKNLEAELFQLKIELSKRDREYNDCVIQNDKLFTKIHSLEADLARLDEWVWAESHGASLLADNPVDGAIEIAGGRDDQIKGFEADLAECRTGVNDYADRVDVLLDEIESKYDKLLLKYKENAQLKKALADCEKNLELSVIGGVKEMEERWRVERKNDDLLKKYDEVATSNLILAIQLADIGEECTQLRELCKEIDSIDKTEDFINQKRREVMKFKENVDPVFTSEDLYDLFDGGYIDPKYLLEEPDASIVVDAIEVIKQFLEEAAELGHVVIT